MATITTASPRIGESLAAINGLTEAQRFQFIVASYGDDSHAEMVAVFRTLEDQLDSITVNILSELLSI